MFLSVNFDIFCVYPVWIAFVHVVLAIALFYFVNWLGRHAPERDYVPLSLMVRESSMPAFNFVFKILTPIAIYVLFIVFCQKISALQTLLNCCYLIVVDYWLFRLFYILATGRAKLMNWFLFALYAVISISLAYWIYTLMEQVTEILPNARSLVDQLWILIIIFLYQLVNNLTINRGSTEKRKTKYVVSQFQKFKQQYGAYISSQCKDVIEEVAVYSIMVYENFNRPKIIRWVENVCFYITKKKHTLGIMQFTTDKYIDDETSVQLATNKILSDWQHIVDECKYTDCCVSYEIEELARFYNGGDYSYASEIRGIYEIIIANMIPEYSDNTLADYKKRIIDKKEHVRSLGSKKR